MEENVKKFLEEYAKLRDKYGLDFVQTPTWVQAPLQDGTPAWVTVVIPQAYPTGTPSPFMSNENVISQEDNGSTGTGEGA